jgi:hypothetical protein
MFFFFTGWLKIDFINQLSGSGSVGELATKVRIRPDPDTPTIPAYTPTTLLVSPAAQFLQALVRGPIRK